MPSIKCPNCGLVNFAKFETCQRCKSPLDKNSLQSKLSGSNKSAQNLWSKKCLKCGTTGNHPEYTFTIEWISPVWTLGKMFIGFPIKLFTRDLQTRFTIHGRWCPKCITHRERAKLLKKLAPFISIGFIAISIFSIIFFDIAIGPISIIFVFLLCVGGLFGAFVVLIFSSIYFNLTMPKISMLKRDKLVLEVPGGFELEFIANP